MKKPNSKFYLVETDNYIVLCPKHEGKLTKQKKHLYNAEGVCIKHFAPVLYVYSGQSSKICRICK